MCRFPASLRMLPMRSLSVGLRSMLSDTGSLSIGYSEGVILGAAMSRTGRPCIRPFTRIGEKQAAVLLSHSSSIVSGDGLLRSSGSCPRSTTCRRASHPKCSAAVCISADMVLRPPARERKSFPWLCAVCSVPCKTSLNTSSLMSSHSLTEARSETPAGLNTRMRRSGLPLFVFHLFRLASPGAVDAEEVVAIHTSDTGSIPARFLISA
ncbi:MAG: hypothetical protein BWY82_01650 [Verrucomicrobia bacterium ADurb.Bin474]|nr:MAG: hypothetical protein BWY82_01650 [Verrucomicrobia bacterium ADurb.Bin474]